MSRLFRELPASRRLFLAMTGSAGVACLAARVGRAAAALDDPVSAWRRGVRISPVSTVTGRHTMHTYYLLDPESPDGRRVLFYSSTDPAGHVGDVRMIERDSGAETVLAEGVHTEDAHRVAMQQWISGGRRVAFHEVVEGRWRVVVVDVETGSRRVVAEDRQLAFGRADSDLLPLYGCHWNPGDHRDLELCDAATGAIRTAVTIAEVEERYGDFLRREFGGSRTSIAFPSLSPDHSRLFFKIAAGGGGNDFRREDASRRQGLICRDLAQGRFTFMREKWGHPGWHPDSRRYIEMGNVLYDTDTGTATPIPDVPVLGGQHLAVAPQGHLWVSDGLTAKIGGPSGEWAVQVADIRGGRYVELQRFMGTGGARSWRVSHPHPVFNARGDRIYYNVNAGEHTQLHVAESAM
ncbi:MAG: hypothetical protein EBZ59_01840 [Planctomycetia bacterium]|nr:hypothetical protein [Planctomycetia bacterium]